MYLFMRVCVIICSRMWPFSPQVLSCRWGLRDFAMATPPATAVRLSQRGPAGGAGIVWAVQHGPRPVQDANN